MKWTKRQGEIMDQAVRLISEKGIQGLTVRSLAKRIGISEPAIYRHFESKTDILLGILTRFEQSSLDRGAMPGLGESPGLDQLEEFLLATLSRFRDRPEIAAVIFAEEIFQNEPRLSKKVADIMRKHQEALQWLLARAQASGKIRSDVSAKDLGLFIQGGKRLLVSRWRISGHDFDLVAEGRGFLRVLRTLLSDKK